MKKFTWNEWEVCTNPNVRKYENSHAWLEIYTAEHKGKWYVAYAIKMEKGTEHHPMQYSGSFPSLRYAAFCTEQKALESVYNRLIRYFEDNPYFKDLINKFESDFKQLKLF